LQTPLLGKLILNWFRSSRTDLVAFPCTVPRREEWLEWLGASFRNIKLYERKTVLAETPSEYIFSRGMISEGPQLLGTLIGLQAAYRWMQIM
jgi:hypothetical protein